MKKTILITGSSGFLGSAFIRMCRNNYHMVGIDIADPNPFLNANPDRFCKCNIITEPEKLFDIVCETKPDAVLHLAAVSTVDEGFANPSKTWLTNSLGTQNILIILDKYQQSVGHKIPLIISSTDKVMEEQPFGVPYSGRTRILPAFRSSYDCAKSIEELLCQSYAREGNPVVILRQCNIVGQGDMNFTRIVPQVCRKLYHHETINIRCFRNQNGSIDEFYRTFMAIEDLINIYTIVTEDLISNPEPSHSGIYCVAPSRDNSMSVTNLVTRIANHYGSGENMRLEYSVIGTGYEIKSQFIDPSDFNNRYCYTPSISIDRMLESTVAWYKDYLTRTESAD